MVDRKIIEPLMLNVPTELRTHRLLLRAPTADDGAVVYPTVQRSIGELKAWMPWASDTYCTTDAERWCRRSAAKFLGREEFSFLLFHGAQHVGNASLLKFDWRVRKCEIGYWLSTASCGNGLMTEAVNALVELATRTLSMRRIEVLTDERNHRSAALAERCGFDLEGVLRCHSLHHDGSARDTRVYARIQAK